MAQVTPAEGGPQAGPEEVDRRARDVVVVTAQKREESVQDIAVAVTAISSELRDEIGLTTVQDYTNFAPGLSYSTAGDRLGMRGVTRTSNNFGIRSGISNYVDGVYFSSAIPASREPIFVERVEVVRGPQGTLYGRDSIGGALNVLSKRPSDSLEGQFNIGYGNFETSKVEGRVAGPITDWLRYSVSGSKSAQNEGYLTNVAGGESEGGRNDGYFLEAQLEGEIGDRFDWWGRYARLQWVRQGPPGARTTAGVQQPYDTRFFEEAINIAPNAWFGLTDPNRVQPSGQNTNPTLTDRNSFQADFTNVADLQPTHEIALEAVWHADAFDIKYLGGYVYYHYNLRQDHDDSPIKSFQFGGKTTHVERVSDYNENRAWYSNEINISSTYDGPIQFIAGLYQYQENYNQTVYVTQLTDPGGPIYDFASTQAWLTAGGPLLGAPPPTALPILPSATGHNSSSGAPFPGGSLVFHTNNEAVNNAYGAFVQSDWQISDDWKLTGGLRWSKDTSAGTEYARYITHYTLEAALEGPFIAGYTPLVGGNAALATAIVRNAVPVRLDLTRSLGGVDPSTGVAGKGVLNVTAQNPLGIYYDPATGNGYRELGASWNEVTGVLGLDWTPDADTLIYGKYNRGYKPGGLGAAEVFGVLLATPYTDKELVDALELGFKRDWAAANLTTNATLFYYDYQGYQVSNLVNPEDPDGAGPGTAPPPYTAYVNLPKTETTGFELETVWTPSDSFRMIFNYGYTNPEIKESPALVHALDPFAKDPAAQPLGPPVTAGAATGIGIQGQSLAGNILPFSPKNKAAVNATYTWFFDNGSTLDASASYFWQDISYSSIFNRSYSKIPAWDQTDARLSWTNKDGNIALIGFVRNVFDEVVYDNRAAGLRQAAAGTVDGVGRRIAPTECFTTPATSPATGASLQSSCYTTAEALRPPRTYGVELQLRF